MSEERSYQLAMAIKPALDEYRGSIVARREEALVALNEIVEILYSIGHVIVPEQPSEKMMMKARREYGNPHSSLYSIIRAANGRDNVKEEDQ